MPGIAIETLVIVAIWKNPAIFQGCFKITELAKGLKKFIFFRCEGNGVGNTEILEDDFNEHHYQFTHFYSSSKVLSPQGKDGAEDAALYVLKYALYITLQKLIQNPKQYITSFDEIALQSITQYIEPIVNQDSWAKIDPDIGFAVAMDFIPKEDFGAAAVRALIGD